MSTLKCVLQEQALSADAHAKQLQAQLDRAASFANLPPSVCD